MGLPLVTIAILTIPGRERLLERAIRCAERQTYPNTEILVVPGSDGTIGEKRNRAVELAQGDIIAHWDDDDFSRSDRLDKQVHVLTTTAALVCGTSRFWVYSPRRRSAERKDVQYGVLCGSMVYWRAAWAEQPFTKGNVGEMIQFRTHMKDRTVDMLDPLLTVYYRWGGNTT